MDLDNSIVYHQDALVLTSNTSLHDRVCHVPGDEEPPVSVLLHVAGVPHGEVNVLRAGKDDKAVPDPPDGKMGGLSVCLVRAHHPAGLGFWYSFRLRNSSKCGLSKIDRIMSFKVEGKLRGEFYP